MNGHIYRNVCHSVTKTVVERLFATTCTGQEQYLFNCISYSYELFYLIIAYRHLCVVWVEKITPRVL